MSKKIIASIATLPILFLSYNLIKNNNDNNNVKNFNGNINDNSIEVSTTSGVVRGKTIVVLNKSLNQFLSIPFAEPPIGELRFAKPKPIVEPLPVSINMLFSKKGVCNIIN